MFALCSRSSSDLSSHWGTAGYEHTPLLFAVCWKRVSLTDLKSIWEPGCVVGLFSREGRAGHFIPTLAESIPFQAKLRGSLSAPCLSEYNVPTNSSTNASRLLWWLVDFQLMSQLMGSKHFCTDTALRQIDHLLVCVPGRVSCREGRVWVSCNSCSVSHDFWHCFSFLWWFWGLGGEVLKHEALRLAWAVSFAHAAPPRQDCWGSRDGAVSGQQCSVDWKHLGSVLGRICQGWMMGQGEAESSLCRVKHENQNLSINCLTLQPYP